MVVGQYSSDIRLIHFKTSFRYIDEFAEGSRTHKDKYELIENSSRANINHAVTESLHPWIQRQIAFEVRGLYSI